MGRHLLLVCRGCFVLLLALLVISQGQTAFAQSFGQNDLESVLGQTPFYDPNDTVCGSGTTTLTGNDNQQKAYNYFIGKGLSAPQVAGIIGNLIDESSVDPQRIQNGGDSQNPSSAGSGGWGLAQWTPGSKITGIASGLSITGPIYDLGTQLDIIWGEMNGTSPVGIKNMVNSLKQINDPAQAAENFEENFEEGPIAKSGGGNLAFRQSQAQQVLTKYGNSTGTSTGTSSPCGGGSASCNGTTATTGNAAIACDVLQYDPISYSEAWHMKGSDFHSKCPSLGPQCATDCSGLVSIALDDIFHNDGLWTTYTMVSDKNNFKIIPFNQVQPGDFLEPNPGHVEIVESVHGNAVNTFGAHTDSAPQPEQVGPVQYTNNSSYVYLRYIGQGATSS